jgi:DNA mismatch repair protein MLH1
LKKIAITSKPKVIDLVKVALDMDGVWDPEFGDKMQIANKAADLLQTKSAMIKEYFAIDIDADGRLCALPHVLQDYIPPLSRLPLFLLRLATDVEWEYEQMCFDTLSRELADLYAFPDTLPADDAEKQQGEGGSQFAVCPLATQQPTQKTEVSTQMTADALRTQSEAVLSGGPSRHLKWLIQHVVLPASRTVLVPPKTWATDGTVIQVACLENLYKIFERC